MNMMTVSVSVTVDGVERNITSNVTVFDTAEEAKAAAVAIVSALTPTLSAQGDEHIARGQAKKAGK